MAEKASLDGPLAKLRRAHTHLETLYREVNAFTNTKTHDLITEFDEQTGEYVARVKVLRNPNSLYWGLLLGDFISNLRASLDHLVWQLVILSGAKPGRDNQFPIAARGTQYWCAKKDGTPSMRDRMLRGVAEEYRTRIDAIQPYRAGRDIEYVGLVILSRLSNTDKHQIIQSAFMTVAEPSLSDFQGRSDDEDAMTEVQVNLGEVQDGAEVMRARHIKADPDAKVHMHANLALEIGFGDPGIRVDGLGLLYEYLRDFLKSFDPVFATQ